MAIVAIGWGSLVWDPRTLKCNEPWNLDGPALPIEFTRESSDGRLTLVLTPGARPVTTLWAELSYDTVDEAREALRIREGYETQVPIGSWPGSTPRYAEGAREIAEWAAAKRLDAVVWTALRPRFADVRDRVPSGAEAIAYFKGLDAVAFGKAREYVEKAPPQVRTAYREVFEQNLGWQCAA